MNLIPEVRVLLDAIIEEWNALSFLPEESPVQMGEKKARFAEFYKGKATRQLYQMAAIPIAQFYTPKIQVNEPKLITDAEFRRYWRDGQALQGPGPDTALKTAQENRFFHWFLEFPEIMARGGFDCILGNPPYLGGQALSGTYGHQFCEYVKWQYAPTGLSELVVFFLRRIHGLLKSGGFTAIITTNSITDGDIRKDGLEQVVTTGGQINMAVRGVKWPGKANLVVSLMAVHKGEWTGPRMLDGNPVSMINTFFEEGEEFGDPKDLLTNRDRMFQGSIFLGNGFLLTHGEADQLCASDLRNAEVIMPLINGKELNNEPDQKPGRSIINFRDWPLERAQEYPEPFAIVEEKVKPVRATDNMRSRRERWWLYGSTPIRAYRVIRSLPHCFAAAATTKYLNFSAAPTAQIFANTIYIFTTDRWDLFTVVQSTLHEVWARKYSGSLKQDLRYSPSKCFDTFAFPTDLWQTANTGLADIGARYHEHRKALMHSLWLGLTKIYNLFHASDLTPEMVAKVSKKDNDTAAAGFEGLLELRRLHVELDTAVRDAYGWQDLDLEHSFHEVETLPENDRVRYTISPAARRQVLNRLLVENHARAAKEAESPALKPKRGRRKSCRKAGACGTGSLFPPEVSFGQRKVRVG